MVSTVSGQIPSSLSASCRVHRVVYTSLCTNGSLVGKNSFAQTEFLQKIYKLLCARFSVACSEREKDVFFCCSLISYSST